MKRSAIKNKQGMFVNTLYTADNLYVLKGLKGESGDLVDLDPPFNSKRFKVRKHNCFTP